MSKSLFKPLPDPPTGFRHYRTPEEVMREPGLLAYQHLLLRAWEELELSAVMTLNGVPTVYIRDDDHPLEPAKIAHLHCEFWNQGMATVFLLRDPGRFRVLSSMVKPVSPENATEDEISERTVESLDLATQAAWAEKFYLQIGTGHYYSRAENVAKFNPRESVDAYLIDNLEAVRDALTSGADALEPLVAHAFLGRILFTCYLCHRGIISLGNYLGKNPSSDIRELLAGSPPEKAHSLLYNRLFPKLRVRFNSSMFDDDLSTEKEAVKPAHLKVIQDFLEGSEIKRGQRSLGFWAYRFDFIPVETISSIYEKFLECEDVESKRKLGAYYTPRLLAEMTLDFALRGKTSVQDLRFIDPSCGSGIFLVLAFNRLVADWNSRQKKPPSITKRADALLGILGQLRGVDKNPTACRISCFSLYLAFLDQFEPSDVEAYIDQTGRKTGRKLPNLLVAEKSKKPDVEVIWHRDFLEVADDWKGDFDIVIGNPPWEGRGTKQLANRFMEKAPGLLRKSGRASLILPSKVFLNQTDEFQTRWLRSVTLETMVQLADYRFILFKEAICPASIVVFNPSEPEAGHQIEHIAPKVTRTDLRDGLIPISPQDRKWIPLSRILAAAKSGDMGMEWKTKLWGTPRDQKLLDYLFTLPRLSELVSLPSDHEDPLGKRWIAGQGCKPRKLKAPSEADRKLKDFGEWSPEDRFVSPKDLDSIAAVLDDDRGTLLRHFKGKGYSLEKLYSKPPEQLFTPPLVLLNQGFSQAAFSSQLVRFQDSLQSFSNPRGGDEEPLLFLTAFLRSKLARYFQFHTAANLATERDKVHLDEVLRLPFFLPDSEDALPGSGKLFSRIVGAMKSENLRLEESFAAAIKEARAGNGESLFKGEETDEKVIAEKLKKWANAERIKGKRIRASFDPLIYRYFNLTEQDIALVEDTCEIFDKGDTPGSLEAAKRILTLKPISEWDGLQPYADMICKTLNGWASGKMRVSATGMASEDTGLALVELRQTKTANPYAELRGEGKTIEAAARLRDASKENIGNSLEFQRDGWIFDGTRILIVKPARVGEWTATAAINDATALFAEISETRRLKNR